ETVRASCDAGIDGITAINTIRAMAIDVETTRPILSHKIGGLSGTPIKPIAVRCVYEICSKFDVSVIGCGGVSSWDDAVEFILAGASAVQIGSALAEKWVGVFSEINNGISKYMERKNFHKIKDTVRKHGYASTELYSMKVGDQIGVRGPYGNSFTLKQGRLLLVGGGTGLVPLVRLLTFLKKNDDVALIIGAKTKDEVFFEVLANKLLEQNKHRVVVVTDDGTYGQKGLVTDVMEKF